MEVDDEELEEEECNRQQGLWIISIDSGAAAAPDPGLSDLL